MVLALCSLMLFFQPLDSGVLPLGVPQLQIHKGDRYPSDLVLLEYDITVMGFLAETVVTMNLTNSGNTRREASLLVRLPPHSLVDGFQLGIQDVMVDGVIQEKHLARIGFEEEKRKRVDPGLIEKVGHDLYRLRVFPITKSLPRKLSFRYLAPLQGNHDYRLDLTALSQKTKVRVTLTQLQGQAPFVDGAKEAFKQDSQLSSHWHKTHQGPLEQALVFRWDAQSRPNTLVARDDSGWHFALKQTALQVGGEALSRPNQVAVFWDASQSREGPELAEELNAFWRLLAFRNPREVALIPFRNRQDTPVVFPLSARGKEALADFLDDMIYDGGTNIRDLEMPAGIDAEEVWLFSDGHDTLGMPSKDVLANVPVFAFSAAENSHWPYLEDLCQRHGGRAYFWKDPSEQELFKWFRSFPSGEPSLETKRGDLGISHLTYALATNTLLAAGEVTKDPKRFGYRQGAYSQSLPGRIVDVTHLPNALAWLRRFAVARQVETYQRQPDDFRDVLIQLGDDFGVVTDHTTLIVFETLAQYASNGLQPPENVPFDTSNMPNMEPDRQQLAIERQHYFARVARTWEGRKWARNAWIIDAVDVVLTAEELSRVPQTRDPWRVLYEIPAIQTDRINVGGNEQVSWATDGVDVKESGQSKISKRGFSKSPWDTARPALERIQRSETPYKTYLLTRAPFKKNPAFYYQVALSLSEAGLDVEACQVASNLLEQAWQDDQMLYSLGMLFHVIGALDEAEAVYEKLVRNRPEWPHVRMFLGQILREKAVILEATQPELAKETYLKAFEIYQALALAPWGSLDEWDQIDFLRENRFPNLLIPVIEEGFWLQLRLAVLGHKVSLALPKGFEASPEEIKSDLRVLLWWDRENVNMDLYVNEPDNRNFDSWLSVSNQRKGFGPDSFTLGKAMTGTYIVSTNFNGTHFGHLLGPIYVKTEMWMRYGHPDEAYHVKFIKFEPQRQRVNDSYYDPPNKGVIIEEITWPSP